MTTMNELLQKPCGTATTPYDRALGCKYYVNSLLQIIVREMANPKLTPMARIRMKDFYIHKPAMTMDGIICMPVHWFTRDQKIYANCWEMQPVHTDSTLAWCVIVHNDYIISQDNILKKLVDWAEQTCVHWSLTDPKLGNCWHTLSKGHRVVSFPLWMYCDDTSGNVSKKWNEHNSFLEYNIHFLSTSNLAPLLEMLDGILD
ncbi:hypothetical protein BDN71DRAFT_1484636 [Pleurotus eryngii]|uniref:Uncharacterized protein n=1 Tax=Pleurotus eryngii TaxID=5323 RepID=A0A9P5ZM01_PLEER|nr:hypothetical protein BDN71DRAFT_1484636 [Pleurotus eryngii]